MLQFRVLTSFPLNTIRDRIGRKGERKHGVFGTSYQSSDKELLPAFVFLYNFPLHIITFIKLLSWESNDIFFPQSKTVYRNRKRERITLKITSSWF